MPKLIKKYKDDCLVVTKELAADLGDEELSLLIKVMLLLDEDFDFSAANLGKFLGWGKNRANNSLQILEMKGYLQRKQIRESNKIKDWDYIISNYKLDDSEKQDNGLEDINTEDIQNEDIQNRDVVENQGFSNTCDTPLDSSSPTVIDGESKEEILVASANTFAKYINYEGMVMSENDYYELEKLMNASLHGEIDASKSNVVKYVQKLYDAKTRTFKTKYGEEIRSLYGFVTNNFNHKTEQDKINGKKKVDDRPIAKIYNPDEKEEPWLNKKVREEFEQGLYKPRTAKSQSPESNIF